MTDMNEKKAEQAIQPATFSPDDGFAGLNYSELEEVPWPPHATTTNKKETHATTPTQKPENRVSSLRADDKKTKINIQFISEKTTNFLLDEAPEMPRLLGMIDGSIIRTFIPRGIVGMLVGAGGIGKTHCLTQLAISLVTGTPFLELYPVASPGNVFLGLGENSDDDIHRLLRKMAKGLELSEEQIKKAGMRLATMSFTGQHATFIQNDVETVFYNAFMQSLKEREPEDGWACIILDPISRFLGADAETDNACATRLISLLERFTLELRGKPTVLFGHHMSKIGVGATNTTQTAARGSSAITDGVRWQANLEKVQKEGQSNVNVFEENQVLLKVVKSNFTSIPQPHILQKNSRGILFHLRIQTQTTAELTTAKVGKKQENNHSGQESNRNIELAGR